MPPKRTLAIKAQLLVEVLVEHPSDAVPGIASLHFHLFRLVVAVLVEGIVHAALHLLEGGMLSHLGKVEERCMVFER